MIKLKHNPLLAWLNWRIKRNKNAIILIVGPTGSAKTYSGIMLAIQCAKMFGTNFTIQDNLDFKFGGLLKKTKLPHNKKPGTPFLFDEVGSTGGGASSRDWQQKGNKFFFSFVQTSRHKQQILIMTCPVFGFLEKGVRSMAHMIMETKNIDFNKNLAYIKPYQIQVNSRTGKMYFKYLRFRHKGIKSKLKLLAIPLPPQDYIDEYEKVKTKFTSQLDQDILDADAAEKPPTPKITTEIVEYHKQKGLMVKEIAKLLGVSRQTVSRHSASKSQVPNNTLEEP